MNSGDITVTKQRGLKAFKKLYEESSKFSESEKEGLDDLENLKIRIGEVLKFYPGSDKVLVRFGDNSIERCLEAHPVVSDEINVSWTPVGYGKVDKDYNEPCIVPISRFNAIVLNIRNSDNKRENCVIGYISLDSQKILCNAFSGELKLQYYDSSIILRQTGISLEGESILVNGEPFSKAISDSVNQHSYSHEELKEIFDGFDERISNLEKSKIL